MREFVFRRGAEFRTPEGVGAYSIRLGTLRSELLNAARRPLLVFYDVLSDGNRTHLVYSCRTRRLVARAREVDAGGLSLRMRLGVGRYETLSLRRKRRGSRDFRFLRGEEEIAAVEGGYLTPIRRVLIRDAEKPAPLLAVISSMSYRRCD